MLINSQCGEKKNNGQIIQIMGAIPNSETDLS